MAQKRSNLRKRELIQETLERHKRFDFDYIPFGAGWSMPDGNFRYTQNAFHRAVSGCIRAFLSVFGPLVIKVAYGAKVTGRKNLRPLKGKSAISITNHFSFLDTLFVRQALGHFRSYHTMGPKNNKTGVGGWFIRHAGMLPFSGNLQATRNLWKEFDRIFAKGKIVNFYAEQAMWVNYQKPRPLKEGAFYYAVKYDVPVVPVFCTFRVNKRGHMRRLRINILPAVYPDPTLKRNERAERMQLQAQEAWKACYEQAYGIPLEYLEKEAKPTEK